MTICNSRPDNSVGVLRNTGGGREGRDGSLVDDAGDLAVGRLDQRDFAAVGVVELREEVCDVVALGACLALVDDCAQVACVELEDGLVLADGAGRGLVVGLGVERVEEGEDRRHDDELFSEEIVKSLSRRDINIDWYGVRRNCQLRGSDREAYAATSSDSYTRPVLRNR